MRITKDLTEAEQVLIFSMGLSIDEYFVMMRQFEKEYANVVDNSLCRDEYDHRTANLVKQYGGLFKDIPHPSHCLIQHRTSGRRK